MKLEMPTDMPDIGMRSQNQKMAELRKGSWMLALEKEQLSRHVAYSPTRGERDLAMQEDPKSFSGKKESVQIGAFLPSVSVIGELSQLPDRQGIGMPANGEKTVTSVVSREAVWGGAMPAQSFFASGRVVDTKVPAMKDAATLRSSEPVMMEMVDQDHVSRQMHLYEKDGLVQVWIRDANLPDASLASVVKSIRSELKESGKELAELTVNGKRVEDVSMHTQEQHGERIVLQSDNDQE